MTSPGLDGIGLPPSACDLLFVYGTLRRGLSHHHILQGLRARFVGPGSVAAELFDLGKFPGARPAVSRDSRCAADVAGMESRAQTGPGPRVVGELYKLQNPPRDLKMLDSYEGFRPSAPGACLYRREVAEIFLLDGNSTLAWIYWLNRIAAPVRLIPGGDYAVR